MAVPGHSASTFQAIEAHGRLSLLLEAFGKHFKLLHGTDGHPLFRAGLISDSLCRLMTALQCVVAGPEGY